MAWPYSAKTPSTWQQSPTRTTTTRTSTTTVPSAGADSPWYMPGSQQPNPYTGVPLYPTSPTPTPTPSPTPTPAPTEPVVSFNQSIYDLMYGLLQQYGLGSLAGTLRNLVEQGITDQASITLRLMDTDEWRQRFVGNELLKQNGLPMLTVAEYLAVERAYAQIMRNYGLPDEFYNGPDDFGKFIGNSISAAELQERVAAYADLVNRDDPHIKAQLAAMGMSEGDLLAFYIDPERANPILQKKYKATLIGASARRAGISTSTEYAEYLAGLGITEQQAQAGYAVIGEFLPFADKLGDIWGEDYQQRDFEGEIFEGNADSTRKRKRLASRERAAFRGSSGVAAGSLNEKTQGQF